MIDNINRKFRKLNAKSIVSRSRCQALIHTFASIACRVQLFNSVVFLGHVTRFGTPSTQKWKASHTVGSGSGKYPLALKKVCLKSFYPVIKSMIFLLRRFCF